MLERLKTAAAEYIKSGTITNNDLQKLEGGENEIEAFFYELQTLSLGEMHEIQFFIANGEPNPHSDGLALLTDFEKNSYLHFSCIIGIISAIALNYATDHSWSGLLYTLGAGITIGLSSFYLITNVAIKFSESDLQAQLKRKQNILTEVCFFKSCKTPKILNTADTLHICPATELHSFKHTH